MSLNTNKLGKNVATNTVEIRKVSGMSHSQVADFTGVSTRTIQRIEAAKKAGRTYNPMLKTVAKIAAATGATIDELVGSKLSFTSN